MNKLPKVFANNICKDLNNEQKVFKSGDNMLRNEPVSISDIDRILNSNRHIYGSKVRIYNGSGYEDKVIISRNNNYLITIDNEKIRINNIKKIELL